MDQSEILDLYENGTKILYTKDSSGEQLGYPWPRLKATGKHVTLKEAQSIFERTPKDVRDGKILREATLRERGLLPAVLQSDTLQTLLEQPYGDVLKDIALRANGGIGMDIVPDSSPRTYKGVAVLDRVTVDPFGFGEVAIDLIRFLSDEVYVKEHVIPHLPPPPPPPAGPPTFKDSFNLPAPIAGANYDFVFSLYDVGTPGTGETLTKLTAGAGMPLWASVVLLSLGQYAIRGNVPAGLTTVSFPLKLEQSDTKTAEKTYTLPVTSKNAYLLATFIPSDNRRLVFRFGEEGSLPTHLTLSGPEEWTDTTEKTAIIYNTDPILGKAYYYVYFDYMAVPSGTYALTYQQFGRTYYASVIVGDAEFTQEIPVSATPPTNEASFDVAGVDSVYEGTSEQYQLTQTVSGVTTVVAGAVARAEGLLTGETLTTAGLLTSQADNNVGDGYSATVIFSLSGVDKASRRVTIIDRSIGPQNPAIVSVLRKYDPAKKTLYYLIKSTFTGNDTTKEPGYRWRINGGAWLSQGGDFPTAPPNTEFQADFNNGYQSLVFIQNYPVGTLITLQLKPYAAAGESDYIQIDYTIGTAQDYGTQVYPNGPQTDLTVVPTYSGQKSGGYESTNPGLLNMQYQFINNRLRNLINSSGPTLGANEIHAFKLNSQLWKYQNGQWYGINPATGAIDASPTDLSLSPEIPHLCQYFRVNTTRPFMGNSGPDGGPSVPGWFDQHVDTAAQYLKVQ
ncbi:hypothetical protein [Spirosoma luteum]|uniref:hypothetical protein n=1 Tax=Spirosoma luteum TaxID=431553 RepID=UPI00037B85D8|nr:hypothetical protein [Spirosoma luteum]